MYELCLDPDLIKATLKISFWEEKSGNAIKKWLLNDRKTLLVLFCFLVCFFRYDNYTVLIL